MILNKYKFVVSILLVLIFSCLVSASFGEWFKGITGRATSGLTNATVSLTGNNNVSVMVWNYSYGSGVTLTENSYLTVYINITLTDADGAADINDTSLYLNVTRSGETTKLNTTCTTIGGQSTTTSKNYTCSFIYWYFEGAGTWVLNATARDFGTLVNVSNSSTITVNSLSALVLYPQSLSWTGISPSQTNRTASNNPMVLNNTGNFNFTRINITGIDLQGQTDTNYYLRVDNFTASPSTGSGAECVVSTAGVRLLNGTTRNINQSILTRGNNSVNDGSTGQEQIYYCIPLVPIGLLSQSYSTITTDEWTISGA